MPTLLTVMTELKGHEEKKGPAREKGVEHGARKDRKTWLERKTEEETELGATAAALLRDHRRRAGRHRARRPPEAAGCPHHHPGENARAGDGWRNRYNSLCLHDPVWYDHLPYLPFPDHWPVFSPKDKIGDWLEMYAKVMEINFWGSSTCISAAYDEARRMDRRRRSRRRDSDVAAQAAGSRHRHLGRAGCAGISRRRALQGQATSFQPASSPARLSRQDVHRHRLEQFRARYLRRPVGARRRRHDGPALADRGRALRNADGAGAGAALFGRGVERAASPPSGRT